MNTQIRTNAFRLMELIYENVDSSFMIRNLDCTPLIESGLTTMDISIVSRYLSSKGYVSSQDIAEEKWPSAKVNAAGIDWVEDVRNALK